MKITDIEIGDMVTYASPTNGQLIEGHSFEVLRIDTTDDTVKLKLPDGDACWTYARRLEPEKLTGLETP